MSKLVTSAVTALALFCGSASVEAQPNIPRPGHQHGHQHGHHNHGNYHGSYYNNNHQHHHHHGSYYGNYGRPSYYPATPYYNQGNYLGLQLGNFGLSIGSTPYVAPYRNNYYRGY